MSVAQSACDFGGDLVQRLSDDFSLCVGRRGFDKLGILSSLFVEVFIGKGSSRRQVHLPPASMPRRPQCRRC